MCNLCESNVAYCEDCGKPVCLDDGSGFFTSDGQFICREHCHAYEDMDDDWDDESQETYGEAMARGEFD